MFDDFDMRVYEFEKEVPLEEVQRKLESWSEVPGSFIGLGVRGARFIPEDVSCPPVYFASDGHTIEVVTKDLDQDEVENYLCRLAQRLGCKIFSEHLEFY